LKIQFPFSGRPWTFGEVSAAALTAFPNFHRAKAGPFSTEELTLDSRIGRRKSASGTGLKPVALMLRACEDLEKARDRPFFYERR